MKRITEVMDMQAEAVVAIITIVVTPDFVCSNSEMYLG